MRLDGVVAPRAFAGATDTAAFRTYAEQVLAPPRRKGEVGLWDNLKPHKQPDVVQAVENGGARVLPAPPWSPDLMPIEKRFSKVKGVLRTVAARTVEGLMQALGRALAKVSRKDILGWVKSCGIVLEQAHDQAENLLSQVAPGSCVQPTWEPL